jgi:energy-coupling factor transporter ATP-binding protein EcfA2
MADNETPVVLAGVTKKFGTTTAVKSLSWAPERGQVTALVGLNGAGKSTTMRVMTGLIKPTDGSVTVVAGAKERAVPKISDSASTTGEFLLASVGLTVFGHAVGVLARNIPIALTVTLGWILPAEHLIATDNHSGWLPGIVAQQITLGKYSGGEYFGAIAHVFIPFIIIEAVALVFFLRHDVNN